MFLRNVTKSLPGLHVSIPELSILLVLMFLVMLEG